MHVRLCHLIKVEIKKKPIHYQGAHWSVRSVSLPTGVSTGRVKDRSWDVDKLSGMPDFPFFQLF